MCRLRPLTFLPPSKPRSPPISVVLTDWLSTAEARGEGLRPAWRRTWGARASLMRSQVPSVRQRRYQVWTVLQGGKSCGSSRHWHPERTR